MLQRLLARWRLWEEALAGMDDPQGEYLLSLEDRVRQLEIEVTGLRRSLSMDSAEALTAAQETNDSQGPIPVIGSKLPNDFLT